jgi:hypothetical protein
MPPAPVNPKKMPFEKYRRYDELGYAPALSDRTWPFEKAPTVVLGGPA